jgi:hypothetical protein
MILASVAGLVFHGRSFPSFPCRKAKAPFAAYDLFSLLTYCLLTPSLAAACPVVSFPDDAFLITDSTYAGFNPFIVTFLRPNHPSPGD